MEVTEGNETTENVEVPAVDIQTDIKFAELTPEKLNSMSKEEIRNVAMRQGWKDPANFKGDKTNLKGDRQFIDDSLNELPVLRSNYKKMVDDNESVRKEMAKQSEQFMSFIEKQKATHKKEIEKKIKESEARLVKAETDFDVATVKEETKNVVEFNNELDNMEKEVKVAEKTEQASAKQKEQEWNTWVNSAEAREMELDNIKDFTVFRQEVMNIYSNDKDLSVNDIIKEAKRRVYPKQSPNVAGANPVKTKTSIPRVSAENSRMIKGIVDSERLFQQKRGMTGDALKKYTKERTDYYNKTLSEGDS